jgi:glycerol-3-phosphate dehydrogenase (NAD(P)+)
VSKIVVLGAGAWGTALAVIAARGGNDVTLCARRQPHLEGMRKRRENATYLPGVEFPKALTLSGNWVEALRSAEVAVMAIPSKFARAAMVPLASAIPLRATLVSVTKGIEQDTLRRMSEMLAEVAPPANRLAVLSGPGFAAELARGKPAALVAASNNPEIAQQVQKLFSVRPLRIYTSSDVIGVELGGVVKNVIAVAAGVSDGLGLGSSARAALVTRGIAEMMRLAEAAGAHGETIAGLAGLGDLVLTCTGELSRNRTLGLRIARGDTISPDADGAPVAEGAANARAVRMLAERIGVEMPIVSAVYRLLYEGAPANAMVEELLSRELKAEF